VISCLIVLPFSFLGAFFKRLVCGDAIVFIVFEYGGGRGTVTGMF
jgi:hypothetical protein